MTAHFMPIRLKMTQRLCLYLQDDFLDFLKSRKPKSLSLSAFCGMCIEDYLRSLDSVARLATCSAGAEDHLRVDDTIYSKKKLAIEEAPITASSKILPPVGTDGEEGVGRESEGNPRKEGCRSSAKREIHADLTQYEDLIRDFWQIKQGSKGDRAWSLLMTELCKIKKKYGDSFVSDQIQLAINGKWKGITLQNCIRFAPKEQQQQSEFKHPASRVFTAKDGFAEPAANPALKELF